MDQKDLEGYRDLEYLKFGLSHTSDLHKATAAFENAALKPLFLLNGGALVVMVAFLGTEASDRLNVQLAISGIASWAIGLSFAAAAAALGYFSQLAFYKAHGQHLKATQARYDDRKDEAKKHDTAHDSYSNEAVRNRDYAHWFGGLSLVLFLLGVFFAIGALLMPS